MSRPSTIAYPYNLIEAIGKATNCHPRNVAYELSLDSAWARKELKAVLARPESWNISHGEARKVLEMLKAFEAAKAKPETSKPKPETLEEKVARLEKAIQGLQKSNQEDKKAIQAEVDALKSQLAAQDDVNLMCDTASTCTTTQSVRQWMAGEQ